VKVSFRWAVPIITFIALFAMALRISIDPDTWWHLRAGEWIAENRSIPTSDSFSLTRAGEPWTDPGWLSQLALYRTYHSFGLAGLNVFTAVMVVLGFAFVWAVMQGRLLLRAFVLLLAASVTGVYWSARPQIVSFALSGLCLLILERARSSNPRLLWFLLPLMALWANVHGGFAIGLILIGLYALGEVLNSILPVIMRQQAIRQVWATHRATWLRWSLIILACCVAVCLNPYGPSLLAYPFKTTSIEALQNYIQEWQSPDFHQLQVQPFLWMLGLCVLSFVGSRRKVHPTEFLLFSVLAYMGFVAGRNIALFGLALAPVLSRHADSTVDRLAEGAKPTNELPERFTRWINLSLVVLVLFGGVIKAYAPLSTERIQSAVERQEPVAAVRYIQLNQPPGPIFNEYNWGGYILWSLYPRYPSFVDGRTDLFDDQILAEYVRAWRADPGWEDVLSNWGIRLALLEPSSPLASALESAGWSALYRDDQSVIYASQGAP
jgi:hypothetical protein